MGFRGCGSVAELGTDPYKHTRGQQETGGRARVRCSPGRGCVRLWLCRSVLRGRGLVVSGGVRGGGRHPGAAPAVQLPVLPRRVVASWGGHNGCQWPYCQRWVHNHLYPMALHYSHATMHVAQQAHSNEHARRCLADRGCLAGSVARQRGKRRQRKDETRWYCLKLSLTLTLTRRRQGHQHAPRGRTRRGGAPPPAAGAAQTPTGAPRAARAPPPPPPPRSPRRTRAQRLRHGSMHVTSQALVDASHHPSADRLYRQQQRGYRSATHTCHG